MMRDNEISTYFPRQKSKIGFFRSWFVMWRNVFRSKDLILQLFKRDFLAIYKKSFLGAAWVFISPLIGIVSWVLMNATGILKPGDVNIPYPAYVLISTTIYGLFIGFFDSAVKTLSEGSAFIMQVKFPHEALLVKQIAGYLSNFTLSFVFVILVLIGFKVYPTAWTFLMPVFILPIFFLGAGIGLIMSVISVVAVELNRAMTLVLSLVIYITPVIYSSRVEDPRLQKIITWNPLSYLIGEVRDLIIYGEMNHEIRYLYASILAFFIFIFSWRLFFISVDKVIEKMI